jgi:ubiquinone/menaquinone biosynthesis C-methylase UbiE
LSVASAESLPYVNGHFRFVFSVDVIHHVGDGAAYATEAYRVLKYGGKLCTVTDSHEDIVKRAPLSSHFPETIPLELGRYPPIETLQDDMHRAGFVNLTTSHVDYTYVLGDITSFRERSFSALRLISEEQFSAGLTRLERELEAGAVPARSVYTLIWATKPG